MQTFATDSPNEVYYSLPEFNFITGEALSIIDGHSGGLPITGLKTLKKLYLFHQDLYLYYQEILPTTGVQYLKKDMLASQAELGSVSKDCFLEYESSLTFYPDEGMTLKKHCLRSFPSELSQSYKTFIA